MDLLIFLAQLMIKDREILELKGNIAEMMAIMPGGGIVTSMAGSFGHNGLGGISAAPGGFPATTRSSASSGLFIPNRYSIYLPI